MNISHLMRSLIGNLRVHDAEKLELRVGQIVRGMVLKLLAENEALVQINGLPVRAKLEAPLERGQTTMLQVQPESSNGQIVLRPLGSTPVAITQESLTQLLKEFGLPDQAANRQLLQMMNQQGIQINKENVSQLQAVSAKIPESIPAHQWIQSGLIAFQRGLPLNESTLSAIHQVIFGKPMHESIQQLSTQIREWAQTQTSPRLQGPVLMQWISQLQNRLQQIQSLGAMIHDSGASFESQSLRPSGATGMPVYSPGTNPQANVPSVPTPSVPTVLGQGPSVWSQTPPMNQDHVQSTKSIEIRSQGVERAPDTIAKPNIAQPAMAPLEGQTGGEQVRTDHWIERMLKFLGVDHERMVMKASRSLTSLEESHLDRTPNMIDVQGRTGLDVARQTAPQIQNLKSVLMQIIAANEIPETIRDSAQQLLQHITGQQLFMTSDRSSQWVHLTIFIPLLNEKGSQTAAINIQSRKGKRGEIDADHCRLLFDLQMPTLGDTLVDVQVSNRIVSVHIHNDHPLMSDLLTGSKEEITKAFEQIGYHISSLKCTPFPTIPEQERDEEIRITHPMKTSIYSSVPYKGVDIRV